MTYRKKKFPTMENELTSTILTKAYEQLIMERTGHRSLEGVQSYKRTDKQQRSAVTNVLQQNAPGLQAQNAQQFPHQKRSAVWITVGSLSLDKKFSNTD